MAGIALFADCTSAGGQQAPATTQTVEGRSLRVAYRDQFPIGTAVGGHLPDSLTAAEQKLLLAQFGWITPENCMKPTFLQPEEGRFNFAEADALVDFAQAHRLEVAGHCLLWARDDSTPDWFFRDGDHLANRPLVLKRLQTHIHTVVGRYRGRVKSWDVVNEAMDDGSQPLRPSNWVQLVGPDFIAQAFRFAHEADPDALLIYNDYLVEDAARWGRLSRVLRDLKNDGVPIHAIGNQAHWELDHVPFADIETMLANAAAMGLKTVFSELDMGVVFRSRWWADGGAHRAELSKSDPYASACPPELLARQAEQYGRLFHLFRQHHASIARVTFWNLHDGRSWLNFFPWKHTDYPLLFDRRQNPKPAYEAVLNAK